MSDRQLSAITKEESCSWSEGRRNPIPQVQRLENLGSVVFSEEKYSVGATYMYFIVRVAAASRSLSLSSILVSLRNCVGADRKNRRPARWQATLVRSWTVAPNTQFAYLITNQQEVNHLAASLGHAVQM